MSKERTTVHKGKGHAKHNKNDERDIGGAWSSFEGNTKDNKGASFDVKEKEFYKRYASQLEQQNEKYLSKRQYKNVKSLEDFYNSKRYSPTEEILQYGHVGGSVPTEKDFNKMTEEYAEWLRDWSKANGNHLHVLNYANHLDEATPHCHLRYVWDYKDDDNIIKINQEKGMKQAGLELPDPSKPEGRYNNRNMTFTKMCRDKWNDICEAHGYEVERVPLPGNQKSKTISQYKAQEERRLKAQEESLKAREREVVKIIGDITGIDYRDGITIEETLEDLADVKNQIDEKYDKADEYYKLASEMYTKSKEFYLREQEWLSDEGKKHRKQQAAEEAKRQEEIKKQQEKMKRQREIDDDVDEIMAKWGSYVDPNLASEDEDDMSIV